MLTPRIERSFTTAFIAFHLVAITLWALPLGTSLTALLHKSIGPYFSVMGLRQEWSLFAPDPISADSYVDAQVVFQNGDVRTWTFPHLATLDFIQRSTKARYRKYAGWLYRDQFAYAWPDAARYIARQFKTPGFQPRTVSLTRHWARIPPITSGHYIQQVWHTKVFFVYQISPDDLE